MQHEKRAALINDVSQQDPQYPFVLKQEHAVTRTNAFQRYQAQLIELHNDRPHKWLKTNMEKLGPYF